MEPECMADALDDLRDDALARAPKPPRVGVPAFMLPVVREMSRLTGIGDPSRVGGFGLDAGFLLACYELAPGLFGDLVRWRFSASVSDAHASGRRYEATEPSGRGVRHIGHVLGLPNVGAMR